MNLSLVSDILSSLDFSLLFLFCGLVILLQILFRDSISIIALAFIFVLINIVTVNVLVYEYNNFTDFDQGTLKFLIGGSIIWSLNMFFSGLFIQKYMKEKVAQNHSIVE